MIHKSIEECESIVEVEWLKEIVRNNTTEEAFNIWSIDKNMIYFFDVSL